MATKLDTEFSLSGRLENALDMSTVADPLVLPEDFTPLAKAFTVGTGNDQINHWWHDKRSILTTANDDLDLRGGTTSENLSLKLDFQTIKLIVIQIVSPDGSKSLRVGPQAVANAWQGPFGGVAAANYLTTLDSQVFYEPKAGWSVGAGATDILRINNPGGTTVEYYIFIAGIKA